MTLQKNINILLLAFPILLAAVKPVSLIIFWLLVLIGILVLIKGRKRLILTKELKIMASLFLLYFLIILLSEFTSNMPKASIKLVDRDLPFLFAPFVVLAISYSNIEFKNIVTSFKIGVIIAGLISFTQFLFHYQTSRYSGMYHANMYGDLVSLMTIIAISQFSKESKKNLILTFFAFIFGITAITLSGSRGSFLSFLIVVIFYILYILLKEKVSFKQVIIFLSISILSSFIIIKYTNYIDKRFELIKIEIDNWQEGKNLTSSIGMRLEMYKSGLKAFKASPIFGYGFQLSPKAAAKFASKDKMVQWKLHNEYNHLHNELLTNAVSEGIIGLFALLAIWFIPFYLFFKNRKKHIAILGMTIIISYFLLGQTHAIFGIEYLNELYIVIISFLLYKMKEYSIPKEVV